MPAKKSAKQTTLEQRVLHFIKEQQLIPAGHKLVVAVSGGPDSVCLLHRLVGLQKELDITLHVAHLDHQLRGADSEADALYVSELADSLGIPATIEKRDVLAYQVEHRLSLEEAAREVRYSFLSRIAESVGAERVVVGHTLDDHVETVLMHLIRGSGTRGLRGLQAVSHWQSAGNRITIIRPLLQISRKETADYCQQHQLKPRFDTSNLSLSLLRNKIRLQLLPLLQSYNPQVVEALLRTARIAADEFAFLEAEVARLYGEVARKEGRTIVLDKQKFAELSASLKRHLLRTCIEKLLGDLKDIETRHVEEVLEALEKSAGKSLSLPQGLTFLIEYDKYILSSDTSNLCPFPVLTGEYPLKIPGETLIPGWRVKAAIVKRKQGAKEGDSFSACLDFDKSGKELVIHSYRPGDRFQPLGMKQSKTVAEFMIDAKIPRAWRKRIPIVYSRSQVLWVAGWRIDERMKVAKTTQKVLRLKLERSND